VFNLTWYTSSNIKKIKPTYLLVLFLKQSANTSQKFSSTKWMHKHTPQAPDTMSPIRRLVQLVKKYNTKTNQKKKKKPNDPEPISMCINKSTPT
jgi:hypothetical protein